MNKLVEKKEFGVCGTASYQQGSFKRSKKTTSEFDYRVA